ncbi:hypothetical protein LX78_01001 [Xanthomarina spongicola]|uniref:Uncharacterized protein n=1 Tax=Xanthomarina spongicola TaxID=570520 RepID=A0A316DPZ8_9FLAO|nr:hypothetical protein LX78_01001 [Xanthomarina spongicola]
MWAIIVTVDITKGNKKWKEKATMMLNKTVKNSLKNTKRGFKPCQ